MLLGKVKQKKKYCDIENLFRLGSSIQNNFHEPEQNI